jgi:HEAT repeat protein
MPTPKMTKREKLAWLADLEEGYRPFDKRALTLLRSLMDDSDAEVRAEAIACLWDDPDPRWIDVLMRKATEDAHADVRAHAISALGRYVFEGETAEFEGWDDPTFTISKHDYQRVVDFLFRIAQDPEETLSARRYAIEALAFRSSDPDVADLIDWAYQHRDRRMKISALFAMARHGDPRWTPYILAEMRSRDPQIQYEAVRAAGELGLHEAIDTLIEIVQAKNTRKPLRLLAIFALGETGDDKALPILEQLSHSRDRDVREVAREAIEEWHAFSEMEQMAEDVMDAMDADDTGEYIETQQLPDIWQSEAETFSKN